MWFGIYIFLWIINIMLVLNNRSSRFISIMSYLLMAMIFVLNDGTYGDAFRYRIDFTNNAFGANWSEVGYELFKTAIKLLGINTFTGLLISIFVFSSLLIFIGLKYFGCSYNAILAMTMPFIFPTCAVAIRLFMSIGIVVFSLRFLVEKKVVLYVGCIILAALFHRTALIYLILIVGLSEKIQLLDFIKKIGSKLVVIISIIIVIFTYMSGRLPFITKIIDITSMVYPDIDVKIDAYTGSITHFGAYLFLLIYFVGLLLSIYMKKQIEIEKMEINRESVSILEFANINFRIQLLLSIVLPFIVLNLVYYRILILGFVTNAILYGMYMKCSHMTKSFFTLKINKCSLLFFCSSTIWFVPEIIGVNSITIQGLINVSIESFF